MAERSRDWSREGSRSKDWSRKKTVNGLSCVRSEKDDALRCQHRSVEERDVFTDGYKSVMDKRMSGV